MRAAWPRSGSDGRWARPSGGASPLPQGSGRVDEPVPVALVDAGRADVASGRLDELLDGVRRGMRAEAPGPDDERREARDVRSCHGGSVVTARQAETRPTRDERLLVDRPARPARPPMSPNPLAGPAHGIRPAARSRHVDVHATARV